MASAAVLPGGVFSAREHDSLEEGLRASVYQQIGLSLGSARQMSTASRRAAHHHGMHGAAPLVIFVNYLALVRPEQCAACNRVRWQSWYTYFPWEDWRKGRPDCLAQEIEPRLRAWVDAGSIYGSDPVGRRRRMRACFGCDGAAWDEEKVLERYELLCEAGLIGEEEAGQAANPRRLPACAASALGDHARTLASAIAELRRTIKYRPVVFELMSEVFTLFELQKTVEAILGPHLHKQNFRRLVEGAGLVEPTEQYRLRTGGRPARLYRFRPDVLLERLPLGMRVKPGRI